MLDVEITRDEIHFGASMTIRFMRTLRVPVDGQEHPLPVDLEPFPIFRVKDYIECVPESWRACPGVFIPIHPHEAMWISFSARPWKPNAVRLAVGDINALTGKPWCEYLGGDPQDYLVCPEQAALSGFTHEAGLVSQFVATHPTRGNPDKARSAGRHGLDGLRLIVLEPKQGLFADRGRPGRGLRRGCCDKGDCEINLTVGGLMCEQVRPDPYGPETWDLKNFGQVCVHLVDVMMFRAITGGEPLNCPVPRVSTKPAFDSSGAGRLSSETGPRQSSSGPIRSDVARG